MNLYNMKIQHGFTIIELMTSLAILVVMAVVAVPAFVGFAERNQTATSANLFLNALTVARSEAIKRNGRVTICGKPPAQADCNTTGNWEDGWTVFIDANNNGNINAGEEIILVRNGFPNGYTLREPSATYGDVITYRSTGETVQGIGAAQATFRLCRPDNDTALSRTININATGRAVVTESTAACP